MNQKETDLIAKALHTVKPPTKSGIKDFEIWFSSVRSIKDALLEKGHIQKEERFLSIADQGIVRGKV